MFETLEHLPDPCRAVTEAHRVLRDDGVMALSVPFNYRLHGFPSDYWRFTASGVHALLSSFGDKIVIAIGPRMKPAFIFGIAAKTATPGFAESRLRFRARVEDTFAGVRSRIRGYTSALKERAKDFVGQILGRADLSVVFFDESRAGGYQAAPPSRLIVGNHTERSD
jgi:SAM-dependent methyltransferase